MDWAKKAEDQVSKLVSNLEIENKDEDTKEQKEEEADVVNPAETSLLLKIIRKGLVESKLDLEVQRQDPTSPLYSVKTFEKLHLKPEILKGIYAMGFNAPSKIQENALPILLADPPQNMIAQSQSGTGKTAAFVLAMLSRVDTKLDYPQVLCLSPTYELAIQTGEAAARMAQFCPDIKLKFAVRGEEVVPGTKLTDHIIIGTPGKVLDWSLKYRVIDLKKIRVFVLDEADVMIATQGHHDQCIRIHKQFSPKCQMLFFSATYDKEVMEFAEHIVPEANIIRLKREQESLDNIKQYYVRCRSEDEKYQAIQNIYGSITIGQAIIFCHTPAECNAFSGPIRPSSAFFVSHWKAKTRKTAGWLAGKLSSDGHSVAVLSGDLTVEQRLAVLDRFRIGLEKVLITTNVLSRGIDVEQVTIVVNFDLPMDAKGNADCETYLHRIGRTGRFGKNGIAINLVDSDKAMAICRTIENHFKKSIKELNADNTEEIEKIGT